MPPDTGRRILIVRLSALGDVIQTLPVLASLREAFPKATLGWLVESDAAPLLQGHPLLDHVHVSHRKRGLKNLRNPLLWPQTFHEIGAFYAGIRRLRYDVALDCQGLLKSALAMACTGIPVRMGFQAAREGAPLFYTHRVPLKTSFFDPQVPLQDHMAALLRAIGCSAGRNHAPLPPLPESAHRAMADRLGPRPPGRPLIVLAPATQWPSKHWPPAHWQALIRQLLAEDLGDLAVIAGPREADRVTALLAEIPHDPRVLNLTGQTDLVQLQALLSRADLVIGCDSAPLHLAGALGHARLIGLYGPTAFRRTPPPMPAGSVLLSQEDTLDCQPCDQAVCPLATGACMAQLTPEAVLAEVRLRLSPTMTPS